MPACCHIWGPPPYMVPAPFDSSVVSARAGVGPLPLPPHAKGPDLWCSQLLATKLNQPIMLVSL